MGVVRFQRCDGCGHAFDVTRFACPRCGGIELTWQDARGLGIVYATTEVNRAPSHAFERLVPYLLVLVDLEEGLRIMAHGEPGLRIGDRVQALSHPDAAGLLLFRQVSP